MRVPYVAVLVTMGAVVACSSTNAESSASGNDVGLSVSEANDLGKTCMDLVTQANSYGVPNQLPEYYGAACTENFIAKQSVSSIIAAGEASGLTVSEADAQDYKAQHAAACVENVKSATDLFSSSPVVAGAPPAYMALIDRMVAQLKLQEPVVQTSSIGPVNLDCNPGVTGGSPGSGGSGGSSGSVMTDDQMAMWIADRALGALTFLWNRDINPENQATFSVGGSCLLDGSYGATGTRTFLSGGCSGTAEADVTFDMSSCEHPSSAGNISVVFTGTMHDKFSATYAGSCSDAESETDTITASGMTVKFVITQSSSGPGQEKTFGNCDLELNYSSGTQSTLTGRACGIPVSITYTK